MELKPPHSLESLLEVLEAELEREGEPPECIGYVSWALSRIYQHCQLGEDVQVNESEINPAIALKRKVNALLVELIRAHVWVWHCGGSEDYGFPGPGRKKPTREASGSQRKAQVIPFYKRDCEVQK